ncbi:hypothetical protein Msil_1182 [Methylocella silvestris BL2]|uniref:Uncharacterized protein n=1 Tax=Methylocella silvestris (strain DSM 15510 / CIP 108128 / LMG 27833 / NCIMB 13906 / BL2) TaxID=395965 RepID=B8EPE6_METSB|nr:hypothetical protein Msil_1182 [Methylocella silvestris BL2]
MQGRGFVKGQGGTFALFARKQPTLFWLIVGAVIGAFAVFLGTAGNLFSLPAWLAALVPTLSAIFFGVIGPRIGQSSTDENIENQLGLGT